MNSGNFLNELVAICIYMCISLYNNFIYNALIKLDGGGKSGTFPSSNEGAWN